MFRPLPAALLLLLLCPPAKAGDGTRALLERINQYRQAPALCQDRQRAARAPLRPQPALSGLTLHPGEILLATLERTGYDALYADAIEVDGADNAEAAFAVLRANYCPMLSSKRYTDVGLHRSGNTWTVVLAAPLPDPTPQLPAWPEAGRQVLEASNAARAQARTCGKRHMPAAPPLTWQPALAQAALGHSTDMATQRYFGHTDRQGREADARAADAGYAWRAIGENIAVGQNSAQEVVDGWLGSPGHCANLMNPRFSEMGAAYAIRGGKRPAAYWTQVFGHPAQ